MRGNKFRKKTNTKETTKRRQGFRKPKIPVLFFSVASKMNELWQGHVCILKEVGIKPLVKLLQI